MTASIQVPGVPQYTLCRGYRWGGSCRMATLSQKISQFHKWEIKNLLGQLQRKQNSFVAECYESHIKTTKL